jgi:hypothetical protein
MADFEIWRRENLNNFAHEATTRLLQQEKEILELQQLIEGYKDLLFKSTPPQKDGIPDQQKDNL